MLDSAVVQTGKIRMNQTQRTDTEDGHWIGTGGTFKAGTTTVCHDVCGVSDSIEYSSVSACARSRAPTTRSSSTASATLPVVSRKIRARSR